ncbi:DUF2922 domain-containing protein [Tumebacillus sp. DT12]|uniref:DUF2922 domain-containing protein n=1 Tax=Tumebacillus lacus TaxID=2995335 RepID=A0ABT3WZ97_9BACL|nr:DUF2922 domain-containing protein [Tumebacillus lacus]MCX7569984.1 DUF2922 domain-containing protein [Tumebacillus lacus]
MKRELELIFLTDTNKKVKVNIPEPRQNLTAAEITAVMDLVLQTRIFTFSQGNAISKVEARLLETSVQEIAL